MLELSCECGNEEDFSERIIVEWIVNANGERQEKVEECTIYYCMNCDKEAEMYE